MITEFSYIPANDPATRQALLNLLPLLRERDKDGKRIKVDNHTWIIKRPRKKPTKNQRK